MVKSIPRKTAIIIVVYNAYEYVKICFESLLNDIDSHHEIIIVDNNSDKITKDYLLSLKPHEQIKLIMNKISKSKLNSIFNYSSHFKNVNLIFKRVFK